MSIFDIFDKLAAKSETEKTVTPPEYIVAGLGNPGREYANTRHNAGFMAVDFIAEKENFRIDRAKWNALFADVSFCGKRVLFMKPQTFMNSSGEAVRDAADFYGIPPEKIFVIYDDINFEPGKMRIRKKGSAGGHKGMKSIIDQFGSDAFPRIRIGVGEKPEQWDLMDWVLSVFSQEDLEKIGSAVENAYDALKICFTEGIDAAMQKYN